MPFISFAQNLEDVVLHRALSEIARGFYVDVGANDPDEQSVTRAFYERGWRGINIEPALGFHEQLVAARPHDINLAVAAGDTTGTVTFYDIPGSELSTCDPGLARQHQYSGLLSVERQVQVDTLDNIFQTHGVSLVHFLKIDVEGMEAAVLRGLSLREVRPWIILVEATVARTQIPNHHDWDPLLTGRGYRFVHFDGLNRFYVAEEKAELIPRVEIPPNIFDDWFRAHDWVAREQAATLSRQITSERASLEAERASLEAEREGHRAEAGARSGEIAIRAREAEIRSAEAEARVEEAGARTREAEVRATETGVRMAEAAARQSEAAARQREIEALRQEAEIRLQEVDIRRREAKLRQSESRARDLEAAQRQSEFASREAERAAWRADVEARLAEWQRVGAENTALHQRIAELEAVTATLNRYIEAVRVSVSWRLTAPVRGVKRALVAIRAMTVVTLPDRVRAPAVRAVRKAARWAAGQPQIKQALMPILLRHPTLERKARALLTRPVVTPQAPPPQAPPPEAAETVAAAALADNGALVARQLSATERSVEATLRRAFARTR